MTTPPPFGLSPATLNRLKAFFARHTAIDFVLIYGSRAKGNYRVGSDIDLAINGGEIPFEELMQIEDQIDDFPKRMKNRHHPSTSVFCIR